MITRSRDFCTRVLNVVNDVARQQYTVSMPGAIATLGYEKNGKNITFVHTDVPQQFQGKGVGKLLAQYAFDHAKEDNLEVTCKCHFLAAYYQNNIDKYKGLKVKLDLE